MSHKHSYPWWGAPQNFDERRNERKISWLELFYDLVYVAAIAQLTHHLAQHPSWPTVGFAFLLFSLIFWSWINGSQYYDLHGNDSLRTRLLTFWQILSVAAVVITLQDAFADQHQGFAIAFSIIQLLITYLWWSVGLYDPSHRVFNRFYTVNYLISFALLLLSIFCTPVIATALWVAVAVLNLTPSLIGARTVVRVLKQRGQVFSASATFVERFGQFTIIVLAESILGTITAIAELEHKSLAIWSAFILSILIAFLLCNFYFDMTGEQETKKGYSYLQWLIFLHFPLLAALSVVGACFKVLLTNLEGGLPSTIVWMFCTALSTMLFMLVGVTRIMQEEEEDRSYIRPISRLLIAAGMIILLVPWFERFRSTLALLSVVSVILFVPLYVGIQAWIGYKFFGKK